MEYSKVVNTKEDREGRTGEQRADGTNRKQIAKWQTK